MLSLSFAFKWCFFILIFNWLNPVAGVNSGHYTAYARHPINNTWLYTNDETVVIQAPSESDYSHVYILFYQRRGKNSHYSITLRDIQEMSITLNCTILITVLILEIQILWFNVIIHNYFILCCSIKYLKWKTETRDKIRWTGMTARYGGVRVKCKTLHWDSSLTHTLGVSEMKLNNNEMTMWWSTVARSIAEISVLGFILV